MRRLCVCLLLHYTFTLASANSFDNVAGFIHSVNSNIPIPDGVFHFFQCTYFFGYTSGFILFLVISTIFPPPGNRVMETMDEGIIQGLEATEDPESTIINNIKATDSDGQVKDNVTADVISKESA